MTRWRHHYFILPLLLNAAATDTRAEYRVLDLGALVNTASGASASIGAINAAAQVAMTNSPDGLAYRAFLNSNGSAANLGTLGGSDSFGSGINASGQVVGRSTTTAGVVHAFIWTPGATGGVASNPQMKDLNPTGGISQATAINASGQIVGFVAAGHPTNDRAFIYSGNSLTQLPLPPGGYSSSYAYGINDSGKVIGEAYTGQSSQAHGYIYDGASSIEIGDLGGGSSTPLAIDKNDRIVGYSANSDGYDHAFLYANSAMIDLGTLGGHYSYANAMNNNNRIVGGSYIDDADSIFHAFITDGTTMTDLNSKVTSKAANWVLSEASGINDDGVIVGKGNLAGVRHGFMLVPLEAGDADADGSVGFADLVAVAQNYGAEGTADWEHGDFNGDGNVDFADLVVLAQNFGDTGPGVSPAAIPEVAGTQAVPEPSWCCMMMLAIGLFSMGRRSRSSMWFTR